MSCQNKLIGSRQCYHMLIAIIAMQRETHGRQGKLQAKVIDSSECLRPSKNCGRPLRIQNNGQCLQVHTSLRYRRFKIYAAQMFCTWANRIGTHVKARIPTGTSAYKRKVLTVLILCSPQVLHRSKLHKNTYQNLQLHGWEGKLLAKKYWQLHMYAAPPKL